MLLNNSSNHPRSLEHTRRRYAIRSRQGECDSDYAKKSAAVLLKKDIKLSSIVRALKEKTTPKKVEDRLSRILYREVMPFDHHSKERLATIEFGIVPVRFPDIPDRLLHMVVVKGFGQKPMMLLTTLAQNTSRNALWQVVEGYITRWRIEDTIHEAKHGTMRA